MSKLSNQIQLFDYVCDFGFQDIDMNVFQQEDCGDILKLLKILNNYVEKHNTILSCGGEYLYQDDRAQIDALELVSDIFEQVYLEQSYDNK